MKTDGQTAYAAYCMAVGGKTSRGEPMPAWAALTDRTRTAWTAAALRIMQHYVANEMRDVLSALATEEPVFAEFAQTFMNGLIELSGLGGRHVIENSSNVAAVELVGDDLRVEFKNGGVYEYAGVGAELLEQMLNAESVGKFFIANIRDQFDAKKVTPRQIDPALH